MSEIDFYQIAKKLLTEGKLLEAKIACLKGLNLQPKSADSCKLMGDIMQANGQINAAKYWYDRSLKLDCNLASSHANLGSLYAKEKQWELAISCYQNAIDIDPNFAGCYRNLGKVWQNMGKPDLMVECWQRAIALEPEKTTAADYLNLADNLLELDRKDEAITYYRLALKFDSNLSKAYQELGKISLERGELEEAIELLQQGISVDAKDYFCYSNLGDAFTIKKELEKAIAAYTRAAELKPDYHLFQKKLGDALHEKGRLNEAAICYQKAIEINPKFSWYYHSLGNVLSKQRRWQEAVEIHRKEIALKSDFYRSHYLLGNALSHDIETQKEAFIAYRKAIQLKPEHPWFANYSTLWKFVREQDKLQPLLKLYRRATKLNPDAIWCYVNLGEILTARGNLKGAIRAFKTACFNKTKESNPTFAANNWNFQNAGSPDFLIIGAQKSGTTSLESYLAKHPQILPAIKKETHFWYRDFDKGIDWYKAHFPPIPPEENYLTGEGTPNYLENCHTATRIYREFPDVKLLVILRNPTDRTISQYYHWARIKRENRSLAEAINADLEKLSKIDDITAEKKYWQQPGNYIGRGLYVEFLQKWMEVFPREQFLILKGEDLYEKPAATMKQVFDFLGLPDYQLSEYKRFNPGYYKPIDDSTRQLLSDYFRPYNQRLEEFLGMKFDWL